ncbi:hypothetical protein GJ629_08520 [Halapricum sp. CBA1109]|uniref:DUF5673 domain-containing protein n=1 Tax=Halapricum sp. CBA1109 TaxID=2668068 RepID=UPI0012FC26B0|nr:DUF5673 domain-containing protein [Halapricum sp. CBA1109]MUV89931.1 hypothetical protein [Halapricum sp. CBA1109]
MRRTALRALAVAYVALLVAPLPATVSDPTLPTFAAGGVIGVVLGGAVTDRYDPYDYFESLPRAVVGFVVPFAWVPVGVDSGSELFWILGLLAALAWVGAAVAAIAVRQQEVRERVTTIVSFAARPPAKTRRQTQIAVGVFAALAVAGIAVMLYLGGDIEPTTWLTLTPVWIVALFSENEQAVAVTDEGLLVQGSLQRWETVAGYELTDEQLVVERTKWYHGDRTYDPSDIEDIDAVTDALDRCLTGRSVRG